MKSEILKLEGKLSKVFLFKVVGSSEEMMKKITRDCSGSGITFTGDNKAGNIDGMGLRASYVLAGDILNLSIRSIPFFLSWGRIEKEVAIRAGNYGLERIDGI
jgi:hypothetical protein